jgi:hypothetical protein
MKAGGIALLCLLGISCGMTAKRREVESPSGLRSGEVLLIGRIKVTPPIEKDEQTISGLWPNNAWRGKVLMLMSDRDQPIRHPVSNEDYRGRIEAPGDREFSVAVPVGSHVLRGGVVPLNYVKELHDEALFPGGFHVELRPDDIAVYIGTIHYKRNEFWQIQAVEVEDEYERVQADCLKRWGPSVSLRRAVVTPPPLRPGRRPQKD